MSSPIDDVLAWVVAMNREAPDRDGLPLLLDRLPLEKVPLDTLRDAVALLVRDLSADDLAAAQAFCRRELKLFTDAARE